MSGVAADNEAAPVREADDDDPRGAGGRVLRWRAPDSGRSYGRAFSRALEGALHQKAEVDRERQRAARQTRDLLEQPQGRRALLLENHPGFGSWWLAALLAEEADRLHGADPEGSLELARLATRVARRVAQEPPAEADADPLVQDLNARSWRSLADAQRRTGDLGAAACSLAAARRHLRRGTREPLERAALLESSGHLLAATGRRRAATCFRAAWSLFAELGDEEAADRCRLALGTLAPFAAARRPLPGPACGFFRG